MILLLFVRVASYDKYCTIPPGASISWQLPLLAVHIMLRKRLKNDMTYTYMALCFENLKKQYAMGGRFL